MTTCITLSVDNNKEILPAHFIDDGRMERNLIHYLVQNYSHTGDNVFDPFAGYGTVLDVACQSQRNAYGVELSSEKVQFIQLRHPNAILYNADILKVSPIDLPKMDLCITSPTYAWKNVGRNPFNGNNSSDYYLEYLEYIRKYFQHISLFLRENAILIVEVSNIQWNGMITPLAWDIGLILSEIDKLSLKQELIVNWENDSEGFGGGKYGFGYDHSYCLIYAKNTITST